MTSSYTTIQSSKRNTLEHLNVLVAEDNEVNQLLALGMLRHWGAKAKVATTGIEVLELLATEDFDLVLMDIQMPDKSGIEAASEIRKLRDDKKKNVPIIALTANALKGEEKKYKAVGMDDYLTKPFKEHDLFEVIERVMISQGSFGREFVNEILEMTTETNTVENEELYNMKQLEEIAAGNPEFLVALADIFLKTMPVSSGEMLAAAEKGDWITVSKLAHKMKPNIDSMNITSLKTDIRTLEADAKNKVNTAGLGKLALKVDNIINKVVEQLKVDYSL